MSEPHTWQMRPFNVVIPNAEGTAIVREVQIMVPMEMWYGDWLLDSEAFDEIDFARTVEMATDILMLNLTALGFK